MAGLLPNGSSAKAHMGGEQMPVEAPAGDEAEQQPNVTPEEQAQFEQFVDKARSVIFDQKAAPGILKRLQGNGNPVEGLGSTAAMVVMRLQESAKQKGVEIPGDILMHGGVAVIEDLAEMAEAAGVHTYSPEEIENATYVAMDRYGNDASEKGLIDKQAVGQDLKMLQDADQAGRLEELLPGVGKLAAKGKGEPKGRAA